MTEVGLWRTLFRKAGRQQIAGEAIPEALVYIGVVGAELANTKSWLQTTQGFGRLPGFVEAAGGGQAGGEKAQAGGVLRVLGVGSAAPGDRVGVIFLRVRGHRE